MPMYLQHFEIDWGWLRLSEVERAVVRRHEARAQADPRTHTLTTLKEAMAEASRELRGREIRAHAEDEGGEYRFVTRDGRCSEGDAAFDPEGRFPDLLRIDDFRAAGVERISVCLFWPERMLHAVEAQASRLNRSLSSVVTKALLAASQGTAGSCGESDLPRGGAHRKQSLYLPIDIYAEITDVAAREERSISFLVHRALSTAWATITTLPRSKP